MRAIAIIVVLAVAGFFGYAMMGHYESPYVILTIVSGIVLMFMEAHSGWIWFVQLRGVSMYLKLLLLVVIHFDPASPLPGLIAIIVLSGPGSISTSSATTIYWESEVISNMNLMASCRALWVAFAIRSWALTACRGREINSLFPTTR